MSSNIHVPTRRPAGKGILPAPLPSSRPLRLCVNCAEFKLLRAPADADQPTCCNEASRHRWLPAKSPACELFEHKMLTAGEVAKLFGVDDKTVRRLGELWQDTGGTQGLPGIKIGVGEKLWRFRREDVFAYLEHRFQLAVSGA